MKVRRANTGDIPSLARLLHQVNDVHADGRPDIFIHGQRKYTDLELEQVLANESSPVFVAEDEVKNFQGMTYGYLPVGNMFAWHNHEGMNEVMFVLKGTGILRDEDGEYDYAPGDFFIFPDGVMHEIINNGNEENEMIFVRVKV